MSNKIKLNTREVDELHKLFHKFYGQADYSQVELEERGESDIGSILIATFDIVHKGVLGEFTVTLTDENHW